ncbi:uncharacterized protein Z519_01049 [Cladophialophora bantiana CBS 173.52]|uniref:Short chain oxidoreductase n=1 Tax=Cladophialophora bantiana (strain ATCC 10958 / CBS 173.52 / CDC B-1940 / NIH 8579) TaxID=1442370 RepID=A0A0D2I2R3_CLAB1|nr:uncharacterized protein Z519_01049 [Cladophialophora bantiana CBS 173.52]KIW97465.1 hypothetical protein Z519_01049 [Cladophialophora bantiana CBS 173.52]
MPAYLVTGAGRGLGLELASQLSKLPQDQVSIIFATTRSDPSDALQQLIAHSNGRVVHMPMAITEKDSIKAAVFLVDKALAGKGLDVVINNGGVLLLSVNGIENMDHLGYTLKVNLEAVHDVTAAFLPLLRKGEQKKVLNITSTLGSITIAPQFMYAPTPSYKVSKAALNMLTVQCGLELGNEGFTFLMVSPGYLKTDMGGDRADLPVEVGAKATLDILLKSTKEDNWKCKTIHVPGWENVEGPNVYDGREVAW